MIAKDPGFHEVFFKADGTPQAAGETIYNSNLADPDGAPRQRSGREVSTTARSPADCALT